MVKDKINTLFAYRFRYVFAYAAFAVALLSMLVVAGFYLPGGLTETEMRSALISDSLDPHNLLALKPEELIYLPYRLLQAASISIFGISVFSIKLPSIILGFFSALGMLYLLNLWYRRNVAIITALISVTTTQFLLSAQAGQAGIMYIFMTITILVAASMITKRGAYAKLWLIAGFVLAAISLYLPLNIYILLALALTAAAHPHARHIVLRQAPKSVIATGIVLFSVIILPLAIGIVNQPAILVTLLGFSNGPSDVIGNAQLLMTQYGMVWNPTSGSILTPVYGLGTLLLIALGVYRLVSTKYTARSYILSFWLVLLIPLVLLNPSFVSVTYVPVLLLIALGIEYIVWSWYRLFPKNPYARVFGLLPLSVLVFGTVVSNIDRYLYGLRYDSAVYSQYSFDLPVLSRELSAIDPDTSVVLLVPENKLAFYKSFASQQRHVDSLSVTDKVTETGSPDLLIVSRDRKADQDATPSKILVTQAAKASDRFYLYKN